MKDIIFYFYGYVVFFYSLGLMVSYVILMWLAELGILRSKHSHLSVYPKYIMDNSPYTPECLLSLRLIMKKRPSLTM